MTRFKGLLLLGVLLAALVGLAAVVRVSREGPSTSRAAVRPPALPEPAPPEPPRAPRVVPPPPAPVDAARLDAGRRKGAEGLVRALLDALRRQDAAQERVILDGLKTYGPLGAQLVREAAGRQQAGPVRDSLLLSIEKLK